MHKFNAILRVTTFMGAVMILLEEKYRFIGDRIFITSHPDS
jgi:hypothetical protein